MLRGCWGRGFTKYGAKKIEECPMLSLFTRSNNGERRGRKLGRVTGPILLFATGDKNK